jgi:hypothetical protein
MTIRMYLVTVGAIKMRQSPLPGTIAPVEGFQYFSTVAFSPSIDDAVKDGTPLALQNYPQSEGWSYHSVVVSPVPTAVFDRIDQFRVGEDFDVNPNPHETYVTHVIDPGLKLLDVQDDTGGHTN